MISNHYLKTAIAVLALISGACSSNSGSGDAAGTGGGPEPGAGGTSSGGASSGGAFGSGGKLGLGGQTMAGGTSAAGGRTATGGATGSTTATGGTTGGATATGGSTATAGAVGTGGQSARGGTSGTGGLTSTGGTWTVGGSTGNGGAIGAGGFDGAAGGQTGFGGMGGGGGSSSGGTTEAGGTGAGGRTGSGGTSSNGGATSADGGNGTGGATGTFEPCPASGACKILPLGDSITWGVNYEGGYRIKLFADTITDNKNITYVGKLSNGPNTVSEVTFPKDNEGHSGWTLQQIDDIVTGKSTESNYSGKKLIADLAPNIILLHAGTNDMARGPSGAPERLGTLIDHIVTDAPDALLVVTTIIPVLQAAYTSTTETYNQDVPDVVQQRSATNDHIVFIDMFATFPTSGMSNDGVHPNQQGYDWMAEFWYDAIKSYLH
jgi:lysophospholipase L1-like esterase